MVSSFLFALTLATPFQTATADPGRCSLTETHVGSSQMVWPAVHRMPFASGEVLEYSVNFGRLHVGSGVMTLSTDTTRGQPTWKAMLAISGGFSFVSVHDTSTSWFDTSFNSLRFVQGLHEPRYHANRDTQIYPDRKMYRTSNDPEQQSVTSPLDEVALVYLVRTLPLQLGQCYEFNRYFQPSGNPVIVHVVRRERITVPAGTFDAIVLRPEITTSGIFSQNGRAELWLSDDSSRVVLQMKSSLPFGSINLYLTHAGSVPAPSVSARR